MQQGRRGVPESRVVRSPPVVEVEILVDFDHGGSAFAHGSDGSFACPMAAVADREDAGG